MNKRMFVELGVAICLSVVGIYALYIFFGNSLIHMLSGFLPYAFIIGLIFFIFYNIDLKG